MPTDIIEETLTEQPDMAFDINEEILYEEHPAMFRNRPIVFIASVILIAAFGAGLLILLLWYIQTRATKLTVKHNEILFEEGLMSKTRCEVNITSVRTIKVHQSLFQRMFGTGNVAVFTAGDTPEFVAVGMANPNEVRELIKMRSR